MSSNAEAVRAYYVRNKDLVIFRKTMKRMRDSAIVPTHATVVKYQIPLQALLALRLQTSPVTMGAPSISCARS